MLLVAVGVLLGQRSSSPTAPPAATTVQYPVVVETKAPTPTALPPAATAVEMRPSVSEHSAQKLDGPAAINVQPLPASPRPSTPSTPGWSVAAAAPKTAASAGWTVAAPRVRSPAAAAANTAAQEPGAGESPAATAGAAVAPEAPASSASAAAPVDPLVQAVREDIREDEARTK
jgi:hypothetical protein